ncbi:MAG: hypothetical protein WA192_11280 [Candidatus Acidiferrales bacterium]
MLTDKNPQRILDLERRILRAICGGSSPLASHSQGSSHPREAILARLRDHRWLHPEHRVVFEALSALPGRPAAELRQQLPAQATRMGFPDVDWDAYFALAATDNDSIEALVLELADASRGEL